MSRREILVVENNVDDLFFLKRALRSAGVTDSIHSVSDGRAAIACLSGTGDYADRMQWPMPWLVFLDLKLPYKSGLDVLEYIRSAPDLNRINVVVVTASEDDKDMKRATELGVNAYLLKPPTPYVLQRLFASPQLRPPGDPADGKRGRSYSRNPWRYLHDSPREIGWLLLAAAIGVVALLFLVLAALQ